MTDVHIKVPDTRQGRWWRIPVATTAYKTGHDRIFKPKKVKK